MAAALKLLRRYSYDEYREWEGRWELIDGVPYAMAPAPYPKHQRIVFQIAKELDRTLDCVGCEVYIAPVDWKIDEHNVVQPDVAIFCEETTNQYFSKTPLMVVEVLSLATALKDLTVKFRLYEHAAVPYYLIVNPETAEAELYKNSQDGFCKVAFEKEVVLDWDGCEAKIDFTKVFE